MEKAIRQIRYIESKWFYLIFWLFFVFVFYVSFWYYKPINMSGNSSIYTYYQKYWIYIPVIIGILAIIKSYILLLLFYIVRLKYTIIKILIYFLIYWFWLIFAIQLKYFEPRYTDIAIVIIDVYSFPLLLASSITLAGVVIVSFFSKK